MKAKRITAFLTLLTLTAALSACGKKNIELAQSGTESETESKVLKQTETEIITEEVTEIEIEEVTQETTEEVTGIETEEVAEEVTEKVTEEITEKVTEEVTEKVTTQQTVQAETNSDSNVPAPTTVNTHTHSWKEHTATTQVWVPNIVTVDDYEEQVKDIYYDVCDCGARFEMGEDEALYEHMETSMLNAARNGTLDECLCGRFQTYHNYVTETVKVGSHEEDHGHYENSTYVDYYYCDCGATK